MKITIGRSTPRTGRWEGERGSGALELVLLTPVLLLLLMLVVGVGRLVDAHERVGDAAYQAARAATLEISAPAARQAAAATAAAALSNAGMTCASLSVTADVGALAPGSTVSVTITCQVSWSGITGISLAGGKQAVSGSATSVVDQYRSTQGTSS